MTLKTVLSFTLVLAVIGTAYALPACAQSVLGAAGEVESSIQSSMSGSALGTGPTLGQLGGVQAGCAAGDAGHGAGSEGSAGEIRFGGKDPNKVYAGGGKKKSAE